MLERLVAAAFIPEMMAEAGGWVAVERIEKSIRGRHSLGITARAALEGNVHFDIAPHRRRSAHHAVAPVPESMAIEEEGAESAVVDLLHEINEKPRGELKCSGVHAQHLVHSIDELNKDRGYLAARRGRHGVGAGDNRCRACKGGRRLGSRRVVVVHCFTDVRWGRRVLRHHIVTDAVVKTTVGERVPHLQPLPIHQRTEPFNGSVVGIHQDH